LEFLHFAQAEACATTDAEMPEKGGTGFSLASACVEMYKLEGLAEAPAPL
jgi:hypothetical protein